MAYVIGSDCVGCGACAGACPMKCISESEGVYVIDAEQCISCGTCAATCPASAIAAE